MDQEQFNSYLHSRNTSMLQCIWPEVKKRLCSGLSPQLIASQMAKEGYWGFTSNRLSPSDVHYLWKLAIASGDEAAESISTPAEQTKELER